MNKVLVGLRQDQLASNATETTDKYELLILQLVNEAKEEVEEAWDWMALRKTVTVTMAGGTSEYTLLAASDSDIDTNHRSKLLYDKGRSYGYGSGEGTARGFGDQPQVFDVTDASERRLTELSWERIERLHLTDNDEQRDPIYFAIYNDGTSLKMKVWPTPADARTVVLRVYNPEDEVASDALNTTVTVPMRPVYTLALWKANAERGEEIAAPGQFNQSAYVDALSAAIAREQSMDDITSHPV